MIVYKDITFCINNNCSKKCRRFLTPQIEAEAQAYGLPIACAELICVDKGEDGVYRCEDIKDEEMS